jgi:hypothetical protein
MQYKPYQFNETLLVHRPSPSSHQDVMSPQVVSKILLIGNNSLPPYQKAGRLYITV